MEKITVEKVIHTVWLQWLQIQKSIPLISNCIIGKYQYLVSNEKGDEEISIVELPNYFKDGYTLWEIYSLKGDLFDDIERFATFDSALEAAKNYLRKVPK